MTTIGKSFNDHSRVCYKGEPSGTKIMLVKFGLLGESINVSYNKLVVKSIVIESKSVAPGKSMKISGQKRKGKVFVPICHYCGIKDHI